MTNDPKYEKFLIKEFGHWKAYIHESQNYLGRFYLLAKREDALDFFEMHNSEIREYLSAGRMLKKSLEDLFHPDMFNYAIFGNTAKHLHTHIIPRYKKERLFGGVIFRDENWGGNYAPYDIDFKVSEELLIKLKDKIRDKLPNQ